MPKLKAHAKLLAVALSLGMMAACSATPEPIYITPKCTVPPALSGLPYVDVDSVYDALEQYHGITEGRRIAENVRSREILTKDSMLEHRAALIELCQEPDR